MSNKIALKGNAFLKVLAESDQYDIGIKDAAAMLDLIKEHVSQILAEDMLYELLAQSFDDDRKHVLLKDCGSQNGSFIRCIKQVRYYTGFGLQEAKDLCDMVKGGMPQYVSYHATYNKQEVLREFRSIGAMVE